jgi:hypothetical protein
LNGISCASALDCWAVGGDQDWGPSVIGTSDGGTLWTEETNGLGRAFTGFIEGVACPTYEDCRAVGPEVATGSGLGTIGYTSDGGSEWAGVPDAPELNLNGVTCAQTKASDCWAYGWADPDSPLLMSSTDGGQTWDAVSTLPGATMDVNWMSCPTSSNCWASVAPGPGGGPLLVTNDGGQSWQPVNGSGDNFECVSSLDCWAAGGASAVSATTDGGVLSE